MASSLLMGGPSSPPAHALTPQQDTQSVGFSTVPMKWCALPAGMLFCAYLAYSPQLRDVQAQWVVQKLFTQLLSDDTSSSRTNYSSASSSGSRGRESGGGGVWEEGMCVDVLIRYGVLWPAVLVHLLEALVAVYWIATSRNHVFSEDGNYSQHGRVAAREIEAEAGRGVTGRDSPASEEPPLGGGESTRGWSVSGGDAWRGRKGCVCLLWFVQTFVLGFPSLFLLRDKLRRCGGGRRGHAGKEL
eukprot:GHVQ01000077.1.p1 GENE.GHVQ01000077.1~~GHVQ01000077.1.p1  ORF type:complete len:244 (-),score=54.99 GHVQ01000077.1:100-831(-)